MATSWVWRSQPHVLVWSGLCYAQRQPPYASSFHGETWIFLMRSWILGTLCGCLTHHWSMTPLCLHLPVLPSSGTAFLLIRFMAQWTLALDGRLAALPYFLAAKALRGSPRKPLLILRVDFLQTIHIESMKANLDSKYRKNNLNAEVVSLQFDHTERCDITFALDLVQ